MKKSLIAMAIAAVAAAPMAANAAGTVYGQLQAEITQIDNDTADGSVINMDDRSRGRIGFKGSEEVGGGMTMIGKMEFKVDTADGDAGGGASLTKREMMVGLKQGWGTFSMGRLKSPYKYAGGVKYDAFVATALEARGVTMTGKVGTGNAMGHNSFQSDSVGISAMGGKVKLTYGIDEGAANNATDGNMGDISVSYKHKMGKKNEIVVAHVTTGGDAAPAAEYSSTKVGGKFGAIKFQVETGSLDTADHMNVFVAYGMKMGGGKLVLQGGIAEVDDTGTANDEDTTDVTVGFVKKLSKKARWFAGFRSTDVDADGTANDVTTTRLTYGMRFDY